MYYTDMAILYRLKKVAVALLLVSLMMSLALLAHIFSYYGRADTGMYDCIVVFGAAVAPGGRPTDALRDRVHTAAVVYHNTNVHCIILSGAPSVYGTHEVDVMRTLALEEGVPVADLFFDHEGYNTRQTLLRLDKEKRYLFVSNDFHLARIDLLASQAGLQNYGFYASTYLHGRYTTQEYLVLREMGGLLYYCIF